MPFATIDPEIKGLMAQYTVPLDRGGISKIRSNCFKGVGFTSCVPNLSKDSTILSSQREYYRKLAEIVGASYCTECCGQSPDAIDVWDLHCVMDDDTLAKYNFYRQEFRLNENKFDGDLDYTICPLVRKNACTYSEDGKTTLECSGVGSDTTFLHGYTITIDVYQKRQYFSNWNSVTGCSVVSDEKSYPMQKGDIFYEKIILNHQPQFDQPFDPIIIFFVLCTIYFCTYCILYFFRQKHCVYCFKKLVFCNELCLMCQFVGAEPPDPFLLAALEEKGNFIQGSELIPEVFSGSKKVMNCCRTLWKCITCACLRKSAPISPTEFIKAGGVDAVETYNLRPDLAPNAKKKKIKGGEIRLPHVNPNLIVDKYSPEAIYAAVNHHDPLYKEMHFELKKKEAILKGPNNADVLVLDTEEEEKNEKKKKSKK